jgi:hypothetical protein
MLRLRLLAGLLVALAIDPLAAQQATEAQREAIRASCRSDFIANCSGVTPGGREAFECLLRNESRLSGSCKEAVNAVAAKPAEPTPAPAAETPAPARTESASPKESAPAMVSSEDTLKSVQNACTMSDMMAHCSWIQPSNPEIVLCLKANAADLSPSCQAAVQAAPATPAPSSAPVRQAEPERKATPVKKAEPERKPAEPERASAPPPAPAAAAVTNRPTAEQQSAIRAACRSDFISHCSGVTPGGAAALQCLQRNASSLSGGCRSALSAISGGGPAPAAAGDAAAPAEAAQPMQMPMLRPREALAILRICGADKEAFCAGVPIGGGRVLSCLAQNVANVTPSCRAALAAAAGR